MADFKGRLFSLSVLNNERLRNRNLLFSRVNLESTKIKADKIRP